MYSDRGEGKCPHCGATIKVSEYRMGVPGGKEREEAVCPICKTVLFNEVTDGWFDVSVISTEHLVEPYKSRYNKQPYIKVSRECCISINKKLDEQTDILKQQYELSAKNKQVINKIYEKVTDTPNADMTYKDWLNIIGTLFGSLLGAGVAIFVFKRGIKHEKEKEEEKKKIIT